MTSTDVRGLCLHETFERQAEATPDATAIVCGDRRLTYADLDGRSNRLARLLRGRGLGTGHFVAIYFDRSELPIVALLACHKSGVAYVPIEPTHPCERIRYIAAELGISACLTEAGLAARAVEYFAGAQVIDLDAAETELALHTDLPFADAESDVSPVDLAYVIYTSGSTGRPKGVMVEHRAATWYVDAFNDVCATRVGDRVYQGFSLSFDGSVEEIWMAFSNGSTLVVPTGDAPRFGDDLGRYLIAQGVTYFSTVPTMLSTLSEDIPSLRTVVLSGEVCPPELVNRWARPGLRLLNVYGPTEATVNTTVKECTPGLPVTIGRPLAGYRIHVVDEQLRAVPDGEKGELLISGPTLARGYVGQPALTEERFPLLPQLDGADRFYRTGDLVRRTHDGDLEFHGRLDTQVKIRGYRVELSEIESVLLEHPGVGTAAVVLVERDGLQQLAAYVVPAGTEVELDRGSALELLEARMPPYMVPGFLDVLPELPRTTSGKVDRARLPAPARALVRESRTVVEPRGELERAVAGAWGEILGVASVSVDDDFFLDLGGHSLLAALMVTRLRERIPQPAAVRDVYECPTVRTLAQRLESRPAADRIETSARTPNRAAFDSVPRWRRWLTITLQGLSIYFLSAVGLVLSVPVLLSLGWVNGVVSTATWVITSVALIVLAWPILLAFSIAAKWAIIGRYRAGDHPLWGSYYWRSWICDRFQAFGGAGLLIGTPLLPVYYRLMGARVGKRCTLDTAQVAAWDLVTIGDDTSIGAGTQLSGTRVEDGMLRLGTVEIGSGCFVGIHSALGLGVRMGHGSALDDQSLLADGEQLAPGAGYRGSPVEPAEVVLPVGGRPTGSARRFLFGGLHLLLAYLLGLGLLLPAVGFVIAWRLAFLVGGLAGELVAMACSVPVGVVVSCLVIAGVRRAILSTMRPGTYPVESLIYVRKWLSDGLMSLSRTLLLPVYTTLYLPPWLRLMGAKIGPRAELSTVQSFAPELIAVGPESFFADGSIIGGRRAHRGVFEVAVNRVGRRSFVGNSAVLPVGISLGDGCLLGVQSLPPHGGPRVPDGTEWLGSPSFRLTHRPKVGNFDDTVTYRPTRTLYLQRAVVDALRILIPGYLGLAGLVAWFALAYWIAENASALTTVAAVPLAGILVGLCAVVVVAGLKKAVMGTFKPEIKPLWSMYVWLNEMVNGSYESVVTAVLLPFLGTPFVAPLLRLMGCRIGKHTYIASTLMSEWDLIEIGDHAALNSGVVIQNHLFEDRVFKSSRLTIGPETSIGNMSVILYDSQLEKGAVVGPLSLLMKGETLRERTRWCGIPTAPAGPPEASAAALCRVPAIPVLHSHPHDPVPGRFAPPRARPVLGVPIVLAALIVALLAAAVLLAAPTAAEPDATPLPHPTDIRH
jgi:non-ribosomal peptide synthetase-like protein